jgi:hypothetical protein
MNTTPSEQWIARRLQAAAAAIPLPPEARWTPAESGRSGPGFAFAMVAAAIALAFAFGVYFTTQGARLVPAQRPSEPRGDVVLNVGTVTLEDRAVTLTESTCIFTGATTFTAGRIVIDVVNLTSLHANVTILELEPSHTWAEMVQHVDRERALLGVAPSADQPCRGCPPVWAATMGQALQVAPGARAQIATLVWPAEHVIVCGLVDLAQPEGLRLKVIDLSEPLQVVR